jgi:ABC-type uncharacterized transport system substrate-binding protein
VAARSAGATAGDAGGRHPQQPDARYRDRKVDGPSPRTARDRFCRGRNVAIEYQFADGQNARLPALAAELVSRQVTVLVANTTPPALAAKAATTNIPTVFVTGVDPVELGLVASLNRPGGNVTGVTFLVQQLVAKRLELLGGMVPGTASIGMLADQHNPNAESDIRNAQAAAVALGRELRSASPQAYRVAEHPARVPVA